MNGVRRQLADGLAPSEVAAFRAHVARTVADVERICRDHGARPEDLPRPSYRAYRFLKDLDLTDIPLRREGERAAPRPLRIKNVVASAHRFHDAIGAIADATLEPGADSARPGSLADLRSDIAEAAQQIEAIAAEHGQSPGALPTASRRAYQWLRFLSVEANLRRHLDTIMQMRRLGASSVGSPARPAATRHLPVDVALYHMSHLYRARAFEDGVEITASECFVGAPAAVLAAVVGAATGADRDSHRAQLRDYARSEAFATVMSELEQTGGGSDARGVHHDLAAAFDRVNAACFGSRLQCPKLGWTRTHTVRKLAHYDAARDRVVVSITLDDERVPASVIDFIVYHELLHRELDGPPGGGRRVTHSRRFRVAERRHPDYATAKRFLAKLDRRLGY